MALRVISLRREIQVAIGPGADIRQTLDLDASVVNDPNRTWSPTGMLTRFNSP